MTTVVLPWPDRLLSPNARTHWSKKASATKAARTIAFHCTRNALISNPEWSKVRDWPRVGVSVTFFPPDKRRRDRDNLQSSLKAHFDGISDALGVDDQFFVPTYAFGAPVKGGAVRVEITPIQVTESRQ